MPSVPTVSFTDERLANGLRLIISVDRLAPVVAVNLWYDVGSKHEVEGKTGFAHLFEHVMFQGSRNVGKAEHMALVQAAGGTMNGSTWLDRTNYYETLPSHQAELALWLEADRMGTLLDALSQENLDNQREVVKNEKRWSYDNRPYGSWYEKLQGHLYPEDHPYHHVTIGSMEDLDAASVEDVSAFFRTYYAPNNAVLSVVGDVDPDDIRRLDRALLRRASRPTRRSRRWATCRCRRRSAPSAARPSTTGSRCRASTSASALRRSATPGSTRSTSPPRSSPAARARAPQRLVRQERIAQDVALVALGFVGGASICAGWATVRPGVSVSSGSRPRSTRSSSGSPASRSATTSWPAPGP